MRLSQTELSTVRLGFSMTPRKYLPFGLMLLGALLLLQTHSPTSAHQVAQGEHLYQAHCAGCHGPKGEGGSGPTLAKPILTRATNEESLIRIIAEGIPGTEMPRSRLNSEQINQLAIFVRQLGQTAPERVTGDLKRGQELYQTKGGCVQCHAINGRGGALGPDLTDIGLRRGARHLRVALTDPEADVPKSYNLYRTEISLPDNFLEVRVVTRNGQRVRGVRLNEDTFSIQLRDSGNRIHSFFKSELAELHKDWGKSSMPSYRTVFTKEELDDLVAFLASLRGEN
jgi:cytochrome c oxidase cbb3-type subunit III